MTPKSESHSKANVSLRAISQELSVAKSEV